MNPFDDLTPEELMPDNKNLIADLNRLYSTSIPVSPAEQTRIIAQARERVLHSDQTAPEKNTTTRISTSGTTAGTRHRKSHILDIVNAIAAALVVGTIIGTSFLLFSHHPTSSGGTGSVSNTTTTQQNCLLNVDEGLNYVCLHHLYQNVHRSKNIGTLNVTVEQAYADSNRVALGYTAREGKSNTTQTIQLAMTLTTQQGLSFVNTVGTSTVVGSRGVVLFYPSQGLGNLKIFDLQLKVNRLNDPTSAILDFPVSLHSEQRVLDLHQSVTANGVSMTLERGTVSLSQTDFFFVFAQDLQASHLQIGPPTLSFNGNHCGAADGSGNSRTYNLKFYCPLFNEHGKWMIHIAAFGAPGKMPDPWVFNFDVS